MVEQVRYQAVPRAVLLHQRQWISWTDTTTPTGTHVEDTPRAVFYFVQLIRELEVIGELLEQIDAESGATAIPSSTRRHALVATGQQTVRDQLPLANSSLQGWTIKDYGQNSSFRKV